MNKILNRNLNKVTKETIYVIQKDWKDGGNRIGRGGTDDATRMGKA